MEYVQKFRLLARPSSSVEPEYEKAMQHRRPGVPVDPVEQCAPCFPLRRLEGSAPKLLVIEQLNGSKQVLFDTAYEGVFSYPSGPAAVFRERLLRLYSAVASGRQPASGRADGAPAIEFSVRFTRESVVVVDASLFKTNFPPYKEVILRVEGQPGVCFLLARTLDDGSYESLPQFWREVLRRTDARAKLAKAIFLAAGRNPADRAEKGFRLSFLAADQFTDSLGGSISVSPTDVPFFVGIGE